MTSVAPGMPDRPGRAAHWPLLGVLDLASDAGTTPPPKGTLGHPETFSCPTLVRKVPGAWTADVLGGKPELAAAYAATARELVAAGATAITSHCGYSIFYQQAVCDAVDVPVGLSALLLLPMMRRMLPRGRKIGLMVADSKFMTERPLALVGMAGADSAVVVQGIEGSASWKAWMSPSYETDWDQAVRDIVSASQRLVAAHPEVSHVLLECTGFPVATEAVLNATGRPVYSWVTLCDWLVRG